MRDSQYVDETVEITRKDGRVIEDIINKPNHYMLYGLNVEIIDVITSVVDGPGIELKPSESVWLAKVIKYSTRARRKNGLEDLKKARYYLNKLIGSMEGENEI